MPPGITEFWGQDSTGKTTLALAVAAAMQIRNGLPVALVDTEHCFDAAYAEALGVCMDGLFVVQPKTLDTSLAATDAALADENFGLVIVDSLPAMFNDVGDDVNGSTLDRVLPKWNVVAARKRKPLILTNQVIDGERGGAVNFGGEFGGRYQPTGGMSLRHFSNLSIRLSQRRRWESEQTTLTLSAFIHKNRMPILQRGVDMTISVKHPVVAFPAGKPFEDCRRERAFAKAAAGCR